MNPLWQQIASTAGTALSEAQMASLARFLDLLLEANQKINLTRITDRDAAEIGHVADALTLLPYLPKEAHRLADVGSGGGVPGLPLAIARPDASIVLIESTRKKAVFLENTARTLRLTNVSIRGDRAETVGQSKLREACDIVVARAVGAMDFLVEWCLPLVKKGGKFLAMKGAKINEELPQAERAIRLLGGAPAIVHPVSLPGTEHHVIVEIPKTHPTPARFPRDPTQAKGRPIG